MPMVVPHAHHDPVCALCSRAVKRTLVGHLKKPAATRAGLHVQAIIVAIGEYTEDAKGNRDFFLSGPPGARRGDVP